MKGDAGRSALASQRPEAFQRLPASHFLRLSVRRFGLTDQGLDARHLDQGASAELHGVQTTAVDQAVERSPAHIESLTGGIHRRKHWRNRRHFYSSLFDLNHSRTFKSV